MSSVCISHCVNDARDPRIPSPRVRATYVSLYRWPESDVEFLRSVRRRGYGAPRVVDSISCRQMYLRSYTFSREEDHEKTPSKRWCFGGGNAGDTEDKTSSLNCFPRRARDMSSGKCFSKDKETAPARSGDGGRDARAMERRRMRKKKKKKGVTAGKLKEVPCSTLLRFFHRLLSCTATIDVADDKF